MKFGKLQPQGKVEFDGYQELMNWTSAGSESSVSLTVDGDTDMEYVIEARNLNPTYSISMRFNNDSGNNYGYQRLLNSGGSISANRNSGSACNLAMESCYSIKTLSVLNGLIKIDNMFNNTYSSGTTIGLLILWGFVYNSTSNITSIIFATEGNFTAGTNIRVLGRRAR